MLSKEELDVWQSQPISQLLLTLIKDSKNATEDRLFHGLQLTTEQIHRLVGIRAALDDFDDFKILRREVDEEGLDE